MKYNLRKIMLRAWRTYRKGGGLSFGECLHRAKVYPCCEAHPPKPEKMERKEWQYAKSEMSE